MLALDYTKTATQHTELSRTGLSSGFTLTEMLIVIAIVAFLLSALIVGGAEWLKAAKDKQTQMLMKALDSIIDEYHLETGDYFADSVETTEHFLTEVQGVGDIPKIIGGLRMDDDQQLIYDAWDTPLGFRNPRASTPAPVAGDRPWFWSPGPDKLNDSGNGDTIGGDDIRSAGGAQ